MTEYFPQIPIRDVNGEKWCSLALMGIKRIDVVAYKTNVVDENCTFAGGHRHRQVRFWDSIHFRVTQDIAYNIAQVKPAPNVPAMRRHHKGKS